MHITVIGTGYVGLVQGVLLAELGNIVNCVDIDPAKIEKLKQGISPIYEPGIEELISKNLSAGRLHFTTDMKEGLDASEIAFIAVGTPPDANGKADLRFVKAAAEDIGKNLDHSMVVVNKSSVPIGTSQVVRELIASHYSGEFEVLSNPEFLREGSAIADFLKPDRIVIGGPEESTATKTLVKLYEPLDAPVLITTPETAEMIKYASNSYLATQISFINSIAQICEKVGADVTEVAKGMKLDKRIGKEAFLQAGLGYGGSCFPKDVEATIQVGVEHGIKFSILEAVSQVNKHQREHFTNKITEQLGSLQDKIITFWGVAFKPMTDDIREAPSIDIARALLEKGAKLQIFDPVAEENFKKLFPEAAIKFEADPMQALWQSDALIIITEWNEFKQVDFSAIKKTMRTPLIFDGRNMYSKEDSKTLQSLGITYTSVGR